MKTIQKNAHLFFIGILFISFSNSFVLAQTKPKGKEWNVPDVNEKKKSAIKADAEAIKAGKDIWMQQCKSCHGTKGLGDGSKAEKIEISCGDFSSADVQGLSDGALYWKITEGRKPMPSFAQKLNDTERWQVVAFIRTLKEDAVTTTSSTTATTKVSVNNLPKEKEVVLKKDSVPSSVVHFNSAESKPDKTITISLAQYQEILAKLEEMEKDIAKLKTMLEDLEKNKQ